MKYVAVSYSKRVQTSSLASNRATSLSDTHDPLATRIKLDTIEQQRCALLTRSTEDDMVSAH